MPSRDALSPCAADALFAVSPVIVHNRTVGIFRLCDIITDVRARGLQDDGMIREALTERAGQENSIPPGLRDAYGDALLACYRAAERREEGRGA